MKIKCPNCNKFMSSSIGRHEYTESGLRNVYLENITIYNCSCGLTIPSIFRVGRLNDLIAEKLLLKPALLNGNEITFLRKNLRLSSKSFSKMLGIDNTTFSKWENERQIHRESNDRLIRTLYMLLRGISGVHSDDILKSLTETKLKKLPYGFLITAEKVDDDYVVAMTVFNEAQALDTYQHFYWGVCNLAASNPQWKVSGRHRIETHDPSSSSISMQTIKDLVVWETIKKCPEGNLSWNML